MGRKLYVGNFPYETGEAELQELFARAGSVETVKVMRDMATGRARGFAFVEMSTDDEAQKAIAELNEYQLGGRSLSVNEARPKPAYGGGGGAKSRRRTEPRWEAINQDRRGIHDGKTSDAASRQGLRVHQE